MMRAEAHGGNRTSEEHNRKNALLDQNREVHITSEITAAKMPLFKINVIIF